MRTPIRPSRSEVAEANMREMDLSEISLPHEALDGVIVVPVVYSNGVLML